jgi:thiol-disulfide isomerase/thioredoxin
MKEKLLHYAKEIALFIVMLTIVTNLVSLYKSSSLSKVPLEMHTFKLLEQKEFTLDSTQPTLIHFWATWCPTCKAEASNIESISHDFQVVTIAVKSGEESKVSAYLKEHGLTFNVVNDEKGLYSNNFNVSAFPTTFIYDKEGKLLFSDVGYTSTIGLWLRLLWASI